MNLKDLKKDCAQKQQKGIHFIIASVVIYTVSLSVYIPADSGLLSAGNKIFCGMLRVHFATVILWREWNYIFNAGNVPVYGASHFNDGYGCTACFWNATGRSCGCIQENSCSKRNRSAYYFYAAFLSNYTK